MYRSVYDLRTFYNSPLGLAVQRILDRRIAGLWPDANGLRVMGCGYAVPYLNRYCAQAERVIAMMPARLGADTWPKDGKNVVYLSEGFGLPIENASVDRILLVHHLEYSEQLQPSLHEMWRVLKPNGRILVVVPNRSSLWARVEWSPFGHGSPFSLSQLCFFLRENLFVQERTQSALFMPPFKFSFFMRSANFIEHLGRAVLPIAAGVHIIEASKQVYAGVDKGSGSKVLAYKPGLFGGPPPAVPVPQNYTS
ncbi:MAG: methyltransferase domain-containing protein [Alphaproteobacteria bacterium]|nr:methyltransferase domain-containing protein [Alphaproteobacteria bacterium]